MVKIKKPGIIIILFFSILLLIGANGCMENIGLFPTSDGGFLYSEDFGENWEERNTIKDSTKTLARALVTNIEIMNQNQKEILVGTAQRGLYYTDNAGESWEHLLDVRYSINNLQVSPFNNNVIYFTTYQGSRGRIYKSEDKGKNFKEIYVTSKEEEVITYLTVDPIYPDTLYMVAETKGVFRSNNGGYSWEVVNWFEDEVYRIDISPGNGNKLYVFTENDYYLSSDRGSSWKNLTKSLNKFKGSIEINDLVFNSNNSNEMYTASMYGLLRSRDGGLNWETVPLIIPPEAVAITTIEIDPQNSNYLLAGANASIYKSFDKGKSWNVKKFPTSKFVNEIRYNRFDNSKVYASFGKGPTFSEEN